MSLITSSVCLISSISVRIPVCVVRGVCVLISLCASTSAHSSICADPPIQRLLSCSTCADPPIQHTHTHTSVCLYVCRGTQRYVFGWPKIRHRLASNGRRHVLTASSLRVLSFFLCVCVCVFRLVRRQHQATCLSGRFTRSNSPATPPSSLVPSLSLSLSRSRSPSLALSHTLSG